MQTTGWEPSLETLRLQQKLLYGNLQFQREQVVRNYEQIQMMEEVQFLTRALSRLSLDSQNRNTSLISLPTESRLQIYKFLLPSATQLKNLLDGAVIRRYSILQVCHQIRREALYILYGTNEVYFDTASWYPTIDMIKHFDPVALASLRRVCLYWEHTYCCGTHLPGREVDETYAFGKTEIRLLGKLCLKCGPVGHYHSRKQFGEWLFKDIVVQENQESPVAGQLRRMIKNVEDFPGRRYKRPEKRPHQDWYLS